MTRAGVTWNYFLHTPSYQSNYMMFQTFTMAVYISFEDKGAHNRVGQKKPEKIGFTIVHKRTKKLVLFSRFL